KESNSTDKSIFINYENLLTDIKPGERIFIDDGQVVMRVIELIGKKMTANIEIGGELRDNQGVAFPDSKLSVSAITLKDKEDLAYGKKIGVDIVAVSFVRKASDITEVKALVESNIKIIAKIELKEAMKNLDSIIDESDGVMVARGDLGVQLPLEQVPFAQKKILDTANYKGKISITATEMLQSMKISFRPTRAEVTDITNAILDGTDAVMLSAETSIGDHPNNVVKVMASICEEADSNSHYSSMRFKTLSLVDTFATSLAKAAVQVANDIDAKAIVAYTETGSTPLLISNFRPSAPIITFSAKDLTLRQMNILWGVEQTKIERFDTTEEMFQIADSWLQTHKNFKKNDKVVIVAGTPPNQEAATNLLRVMKIGE
ncbi:MAG: pyruvate kinase, partial [Candidatus Actinomarina sp.]|nr:pyruvate kinase [Candidatus Actinomarina sp.]